jgi:hypothetical protein
MKTKILLCAFVCGCSISAGKAQKTMLQKPRVSDSIFLTYCFVVLENKVFALHDKYITSGKTAFIPNFNNKKI